MILFDQKEKVNILEAIIKAKIEIELIKNPDSYLGSTLFAYEDDTSNFDIINFVLPGKSHISKYFTIGDLRFSSYDVCVTDIAHCDDIASSDILYDPNEIIKSIKERLIEQGDIKIGSNQYVFEESIKRRLSSAVPSRFAFDNPNREHLAILELVISVYQTLLDSGYDERTLFRLASNTFFSDEGDNILGIAYACYKKANDITESTIDSSFQKFLK